MNGIKSKCNANQMKTLNQRNQLPSCIWNLINLRNISFAGGSYEGVIPNITINSNLELIQGTNTNTNTYIS